MAPVEKPEERTTPIIGIIYPPPEVRNIVDKTAAFVARNGFEFEQRIKANEVNNPKFNFLNPGDPYHAYYRHKVIEIREGRDDGKVEKADKPATTATTETTTTEKKPAGQTSSATEAMKQRQSEILKQAQKEVEPPPPKEPPPDFEFTADPPSISAFDLDVVKLTAQFVARNGRQFLTSLMQKEQRNYQFDFLRPTHSLFQYFTKLLEQYTKVLIPPKELVRRLKDERDREGVVKAQVDYRVRWLKAVEAQRRKQEEEAERERVSYAQIDWHSFVVVETVDYQQWEVGNFPPPTNPADVGARVLMQRRMETAPRAKASEPAGESNMNVEDMEEGSSSEDSDDEEEANKKKEQGATAGGKQGLKAVDSAPDVPTMPPPSLPTPGNVEVRKYDPKQAKGQKNVLTSGAAEDFLVSPITGERVPASKVQEHMRIGLLDPRWVEERDKQITARATEDAVYAPGHSIDDSLKQLAERRSDIFGVGEEAAMEADIGKRMGDVERRSVLAAAAQEANIRPDVGVGAGGSGSKGGVNAWDGHSGSARAAQEAAKANISLKDQMAEFQRKRELEAAKEKIGPKLDAGGQPTDKVPPPPPTAAPPVIPSAAPPQIVAAPPIPPLPVAAAPVLAPPVPVIVPQPQPFFVASQG